MRSCKELRHQRMHHLTDRIVAPEISYPRRTLFEQRDRSAYKRFAFHRAVRRAAAVGGGALSGGLDASAQTRQSVTLFQFVG
jgi:hypothetical protein